MIVYFICFAISYPIGLGDEQEHRCLEMKGLNLIDIVFVVKGAQIAFSIWDVGGTLNSF